MINTLTMSHKITFHSEIKMNGAWIHHCEFHIENHPLYARLGTLHNEWGLLPLLPPKGLPRNVTLLTWCDATLHGEQIKEHTWLGETYIARIYEFIRDTSNPEEWFGGDRHKFEESIPLLFGRSFYDYTQNRELRDSNGIDDFRFVVMFIKK